MKFNNNSKLSTLTAIASSFAVIGSILAIVISYYIPDIRSLAIIAVTSTVLGIICSIYLDSKNPILIFGFLITALGLFFSLSIFGVIPGILFLISAIALIVDISRNKSNTVGYK